MPAKSGKQYRLMAAIAHGADIAGPSKVVAEKFVHETPKEKRSMFMKKRKEKK